MASRSPHSYLVLRDHGEDFPQGALVTLEGNECRLHTHNTLVPLSCRGIVPDGDLAGLTEEECVLLDAFGTDDAARYAVYSTPGKLKWGAGLQVGDTVLARLPAPQGEEEEEYVTAIIRWKGMTGSGIHHFGVEIKASDVEL